ncbi:MAG: LamG domain-containing protein [Armatimonadota bacterium]
MSINITVPILIAVFATAILSIAHAQEPALVAHWSFGEGSGSVVKDVSGNGHDGSIKSAVWAKGIKGGALSFDGSSGSSVSIDSSRLPALKAFTIEAWIHPTDLNSPADKYIVSWWDHFLLRIDRPGFNSATTFYTFTNADPGTPAKGPAPQTNVWQHLVGTWDGSTAQLWVNGVKVAEMPRSGPLGVTDKPFDIGSSFIGLIDEVKLYDRALSAKEIAEQFGMSARVMSFQSEDPVSLAQIPARLQLNLMNTSQSSLLARPLITLPAGVKLVGNPPEQARIEAGKSRKFVWTVISSTEGMKQFLVEPGVAGGGALPASAVVRFLPAINNDTTLNTKATQMVFTSDATQFAVTAEPQGLNVTASSHGCSYKPLAGLGPIFRVGDVEQRPGSYPAQLVSVKQQPRSLSAIYRAFPEGIKPVEFTVTATPAKQGMSLEFDCQQPVISAVTAGVYVGVDTLRSQPVGRYQEQGGEGPFRVFWLAEAQSWAWAEWDFDKSNCSVITPTDATPNRQPLVGDQIYMNRQDGSRMPMHEVLNLRLGSDLWKTIGPLPNQPTPYAKELRNMVCADLWGGSFPVCKDFLEWLDRSTAGAYKFLTIVHDWQSPAYDTNLPEVMPPNAKYGGEQAMRTLLATGNRIGRIGLHNNYLVTGLPGGRAEAAGARPYLSPTGGMDKVLGGYRPAPISMVEPMKLIEPEVHAMGTSAVHLDEHGAIGLPVEGWAFGINCDPKHPDEIMLRTLIRGMRETTLTAKKIHQGPVFVETGGNEYLEGYSDCNDYGVLKGTARVLWPDYKLHRIQPLIGGYGMGLYYRYFLSPSEFYTPWPSPGVKQEEADDYRTAQLFYANGAYLFWYPGMPKEFAFTEVGLVGTLQPYYMFQKIQEISYLCADRKWRSFAELIQQDFPRDRRYVVKEIFANGYSQIVNRTADEVTISTPRGEMILPKNSFVAWKDSSLYAYSAYAPGTQHRVDYAEDKTRQIKFINPRTGSFQGVTVPSIWVKGKLVEVSFTPDKLPQK